MDKLKEPAMLLSVVNSVSLVGTTAYFYKQLEAIYAELAKTTQSLTGIVAKITEMERGNQQKSEALHVLGDQLKRVSERISDLPSLDDVEELEENVQDIVLALEDNDILVERQEKHPPERKHTQRSRNNQEKRTHGRRQIEQAPEGKRTRRGYSKSFTEPKLRESEFQRGRSNIQDDDSALIGEVLKQQGAL